MHQLSTPEPPDEIDVITRKKLPIKITDDARLADQIRKQDAALMREGLAKAGVREDTIELLETLDGLAVDGGRFLVSSLDLSHRMMILSNIELLERARDIKKDYLENEALEDEYKIEWQKAYNEIVDIIRKGYEATLAGTQAMARMMGSGKKNPDERAEPGFQPIKKAKKV